MELPAVKIKNKKITTVVVVTVIALAICILLYFLIEANKKFLSSRQSSETEEERIEKILETLTAPERTEPMTETEKKDLKKAIDGSTASENGSFSADDNILNSLTAPR